MLIRARLVLAVALMVMLAQGPAARAQLLQPHRLISSPACGDAALSEQGDRLAVAAQCGETGAKIFDTATGALVVQFSHPQFYVKRLLFSPSGAVIASREYNVRPDRLIDAPQASIIAAWRLYDARSGRELGTAEESPEAAATFGAAAFFTPDERRFGYTMLSSFVFADMNDIDALQKDVWHRSRHEFQLLDAEVSPDGRLLAYAQTHTLDLPNVVLLGELSSGEDVASLLVAGLPFLVKFSPDGRMLATSSVNQEGYDTATAVASLQVWNTDRASPRFGSAISGPANVGATINDIAFSADGRLMFGAASDRVWVWDTATWRVVRRIDGDAIAAAANRLFTVWDRTVTIWSLPELEQVAQIQAEEPVTVVQPSADGAVLLLKTETGPPEARVHGAEVWSLR